jgi:5-methylcytosine-specific restriction endonuclease McrA
MEKLELIYSAIRETSDELIKNGDAWSKQLRSSKNYICTPDLQHWTFGKSVGDDGEYHYNGGVAKDYLYRLGFENVLSHPKKEIRQKYTEAFLIWADKVKGYPIAEKFHNDQSANKRFELLIHKRLLEKFKSPAPASKKDPIEEFDEGFKKEIVIEVSTRDRKLTAAAKKKYGTKCAVCSFDFGAYYGDHGDGFIEIHHLVRIAEGSRKTTLEDVRPVCSNCHRMLHRGNTMLTNEQLKDIIEKKKNSK